MIATTHPSRSLRMRNNNKSSRVFDWNRAHWIGMVSLTALLILLVWSSSAFTSVIPTQTPDRFVWLPSMTAFWPISLALANLLVGMVRTGSWSFPLASAVIGPLGFGWGNLRLTPGSTYRTWDEWLSLMHTDGLRLVGQTLYGMAVLLAAYAALAFACYAIGRFALRSLVSAASARTQTANEGRLTGWIRRDIVRFGCWVAAAVLYALLLMTMVIPGQGMAFVLMINFVAPPVLLVIGGAYASRDTALARPWRSLLFAAVCPLIMVPLLLAIIPFSGGFVGPDSMSQVGFFAAVFMAASLIGFGAVWTVRWCVAKARHSR